MTLISLSAGFCPIPREVISGNFEDAIISLIIDVIHVAAFIHEYM